MLHRQIFRKKSIEQFGSPEKLDELLKVTSTRSWLLLISLLLIVIIVLIWAFFGTILTKATGTGTFNHPNQHLVALYAGQVDSIFVSNGDNIQKGQVVAKIIPEDELDKISQPEGIGKKFYITSTVAGKIAETRITEGSFIEARSILFTIQWIQSVSKPQITFFIDGFHMQKIQTDMEVIATVESTGRNNTFTGKIIQISPFPASHDRLASVFENQNMIQHIEMDNPYEIISSITVPPEMSEEEFNKNNGKTCSIEVIIQKSRPINLLFTK